MSERRRRGDKWRQEQPQQDEIELSREPLWHEIEDVPQFVSEKPTALKSAVAKPVKEKRTITHVTIVGGHARTKAGSAIGRGAAGAAVLGPVGLLFAASAKKNDYVSLLVYYDDGNVETVKTKVGSMVFNMYVPYIKE